MRRNSSREGIHLCSDILDLINASSTTPLNDIGHCNFGRYINTHFLFVFPVHHVHTLPVPPAHPVPPVDVPSPPTISPMTSPTIESAV